MDELWRSLATVAVGIVPAYLLYKQNKNSEDRQQTERREIRDQDDARLTAESERAERDADAAQTDGLRASLVRFVCIADKIATQRLMVGDAIATTQLDHDDAQELTSAYADVALRTQSNALLTATDNVRTWIEGIVIMAATFRGAPDAVSEQKFRDAMDEFRRTAREALGVTTIVRSSETVEVVQSAMGQEPTPPREVRAT